jgi:ASC-1-like (ASCH) protein
MPTYQMKLSKEPFEKIASGQKIIESRLYDEKRQQINIGDCVEFVQNDGSNKKTSAKVKALYRYSSFDDLFSDFPPEFFGGVSKEMLIEEIKNFYSVEEEQRYGVVGIKIELLQ